ncbi:MAG: TrkH family potassium uptake protein [Pseudomonadota bacterium]
MIDLRPVFYVIGLMTAALGLFMIAPMIADLAANSPNWRAFAMSAFVTVALGLGIAVTCRQGRRQGLSIRQTFLLTTLTWSLLPVAATLPMMIGAPRVGFTDAFFEAVSGMTTTGSTVIEGLEHRPPGLILWRAILQWIGGIGIIVVAMAFLPAMKVGGMQFFRSEGFDTFGKILPRAAEIAVSIGWIYLGLTGACLLAYEAAGMGFFDALIHAMTTIATGGFSSWDASFARFAGPAEYVAILFMILASLPFVRFIQLAAGTARPLFRDPQIRAYLALILGLSLGMAALRTVLDGVPLEESLRQSSFNIVSILSGTGYASADYMTWGAFAVAVFFLIGLIGGCTGSTACSVKIFRYQIAIASIGAQIRSLHSPHGVFVPRYQGRRVDREVINSVSAFFALFFFTLTAIALILSVLGLDTITAVSGAATALANIGPGLGDEIGPTGNFARLSDPAKWVLTAAMLIGRLELFAVYILLTRRFWAD